MRQPYSPYLMIFLEQIKKMQVHLFFSTCPLHSTSFNGFLLCLSDRTQFVHVGAYASSVVYLLFDVAQGSVLGSRGPLFIIYVTPFAETTATEGVQESYFSDDKQVRSRFVLKENFYSQSQCSTRSNLLV